MKVIGEREKEIFKPIELKIILESEDEINAFYSIFNWAPLDDICRKYGIKSDLIRNKIYTLLGKYPDYDKIFKEITQIIY